MSNFDIPVGSFDFFKKWFSKKSGGILFILGNIDFEFTL
jgi:hypothetical protein